MDEKTLKLRHEQWLPIFEEQAKSGMGKDEWIRAHGIKRWEFYKRQRECRRYQVENKKMILVRCHSGIKNRDEEENGLRRDIIYVGKHKGIRKI